MTRRHLHVAVWTLFATLTAILTFATPFAAILAPGLLGGGLVALVFFLRARRDRRAGRHAPVSPDVFGADTGSTDVINFAHIRVAGVGGLGLVAVALAVAFDIVRVGQTLAVGAVCGSLLALLFILRRRRTGPLPSGRTPGANAMLKLDDREETGARPGPDRGPARPFRAAPGSDPGLTPV